MNACPDTGALRALLDDEAPRAVALHAAACVECAAELADLREHERFTSRALALLAPPAAVATTAAVPPSSVRVPPPGGATAAAGVPASSARGLAPAGAPGLVPPAAGAAPPAAADDELARRRRVVVPRRAAAAAVVVALTSVLVGTPDGRQAAAAFLAQFRSERIAVVSLDAHSGFGALSALQALGDVDNADAVGAVQPAASLAAAERRVGFTIAEPDPAALPAAFAGDPEIVVTDAVELRLTFDEARVRDWLVAQGRADHPVPDGLHGTSLVVDVPAAAALMYRGRDSQQLVVGQSGLVTAHTEGALTLDEVRGFLLDLPGLPADTVRQLRAIEDWRNTLPLPVPADLVRWRDITVQGGPAVSLQGTDGLGSVIVWQRGGLVHGVGGLVAESDARRVAESLRR